MHEKYEGNPIHYRDAIITAIAFEVRPGVWRGTFIMNIADNSEPYQEDNLSEFETKEEAEHQALVLGRVMYDRKHPR